MFRRSLLSSVAAILAATSSPAGAFTSLPPPPPAAPSDGLNVAPFGAVYDGLDGVLSATITSGTTALTIGSQSALLTATIAQGSNLLTVTPNNNQIAPQPYDVGKPIAIPGAGAAGGVLVTTIAGITIAGVTLGTVVQLADVAQTAISGVSTAAVWPCFRPRDVGKRLWASCLGAANTLAGTGSAQPLLTTITAYVSPTQVTLADPAGSQIGDANNNCAAIVWGTDNTNAISAARQSAAALSTRNLFYAAAGNPTALCCAFNMAVAGPIMDAVGNAIHLGAGVRSFWTDSTGLPIQKGIVPISAPSPRPPKRRLSVRRDCPRFTAAANPVVVSWGDSMGADQQTESPSFSQITQIKNALISNNRAKNITFYNRAIGGTVVDQMLTGPATTGPTWYNDLTATWASYVSSLSPDLIILAQNGGNDAFNVNPEAMPALINLILSTFPKDGSARPPDIIMVNNRSATLANDFPNGRPLSQDNRERVSALYRSIAAVRGFGFPDYYDQMMVVRQGWSPTRLALRQLGQGKACIVSTVRPYGLGQAVRDFDVVYSVAAGGSAGAADIWASWGTFTCQIGSQYGNNLVLGLDASGNVTCQVNTFSYTVPSSVSITSGAAVLTVGGTTTTPITTGTFTADPSTGGAVFAVTGATPFTSGMVGQGIIIPGSGGGGINPPAHYSDFRTQIIGFVSTSSVILADPMRVASVGAVSIITGPMLFHPNDATAAIDIVVPGAGAAGAPLATKVLTYTSQTQVTLAANAGTTLAASTQSVFLGRVCVPKFSTAINPNSNSYTANQWVRVSRRAEILYVTLQQPTVAKSVTVTINSASPNLSTSAPVFTAAMVGWPITIAGAGAAGGTLTSVIKTFTNSQAVVLNGNAGTTVTAVSEAITIGPGPEDIIFEGPVEYFGGPFVPLVWPGIAAPAHTPTAGPKFQVTSLADYPIYARPLATDLELWGTTDSYYFAGGAGINHDDTIQSVLVDGPVIDAQDWSAS